MGKKAAVVIGVDKTGPLPRLNSAAEGALEVAAWLEGEGYKVNCLTDKAGPVDSRQVEDAIAEFVTLPPRFSLLVIYFSGHGYWHARADRWLLSGAPVRTSEAINLDGAMDLARYSGIPNVVFISDACRSIPNSRAGTLLQGIDAFPNYAEIDQISKVDCFKATSEALSAYEGPIDGKLQSVLTRALQSAFEAPEPYMVREIVEGQETIKVVPNRRLDTFLQSKVDALLAAIDPALTQRIEANVPSSEDVYLARVRIPALSTVIVPGPANAIAVPSAADKLSIHPGNDAATTLAQSLSTRPFAGGGPDATLMITDPRTENELRQRLPDQTIGAFESQAGFVVRGAPVAMAIAAKDGQLTRAELLQGGDGLSVPGIVGMHAQAAISVALQFQDGRCAVVPCLPGYIGHATVAGTGMLNVSYVPSSNHWRWAEYAANRENIDRLRALVALAVEHNTFRLRSNRDANAFAARIRTMKSIDPTLGLYAAHAFSQAGNDAEVVSILDYMRQDLQADLFDVRMLAMRSHTDRTSAVPLVPFCPMLTQSWNLLRPRGIALPQTLQRATAYLCDSLWTTFEPPGATAIIDAIQTGELQ